MSVVYRPQFQRSAALVSRLTLSTEIVTWIQGQMIDVGWVARTQRDALVRMAHFSTRIEGNPLTLPEVQALAEGKQLSVDEKAKKEVLNYFAALRWIWQKSPREVLEEDILRLHRFLTDGVLPKPESGEYKTRPNAVFSGGRIIYKPPPPEAAPILTRSLLAWLNGRESQEEHPVIASAIAHHRLASIHPFMDGNGRISRALGAWILFRRGFDTQHIFALDEFFEQDRQRYYREIQNARDEGEDLTHWLEYVAEGVLETLKKTQSRIQSLRAKTPSVKVRLLPKQERILQVLSQTSSLGGGELARALVITRAHLSKLMRPLVDAGLIEKEGSTRSAVYRLY